LISRFNPSISRQDAAPTIRFAKAYEKCSNYLKLCEWLPATTNWRLQVIVNLALVKFGGKGLFCNFKTIERVFDQGWIRGHGTFKIWKKSAAPALPTTS
jgi:hypothetical protein